jgi:uncharacterized membrane protein YeaQ/YmgE (transglycosylase-associated protein family)
MGFDLLSLFPYDVLYCISCMNIILVVLNSETRSILRYFVYIIGVIGVIYYSVKSFTVIPQTTDGISQYMILGILLGITSAITVLSLVADYKYSSDDKSLNSYYLISAIGGSVVLILASYCFYKAVSLIPS